MASYLCRAKILFQLPRYVPTLIARAQASKTIPTSGGGTPMSGSTKTVSQTGGTKSGDSSVLPKSSTDSDHTNPTKTSSDAPPLDHENVDLKNKQTTTKTTSSTSTKESESSSSSSSSDDMDNSLSVMNTTWGQFGMVAVLALTAYASYQLMKGCRPNRNDLRNNKHYIRATADYQEANTQGTDVKA